MKALILAGGYGTRLQELGKNTPKALLKVQNKYLIDYTLDKVKGIEEITEVLVVTNNRFYKVFLQWALDHSGSRQPIRIINDGTNTPEDRLGSIGDIDFVIRQEKVADDVLVLGGDNLFAEPLGPYVRFSQQKSPAVTIGLYDIGNLEAAKRFGVVETDAANRITSFEEKPSQPRSSLIGMCLYYLPKKSLGDIARYLLESGKSDTAGDYIRWLCRESSVYGFLFHGKWYDIGSIESYHDANLNFR